MIRMLICLLSLQTIQQSFGQECPSDRSFAYYLGRQADSVGAILSFPPKRTPSLLSVQVIVKQGDRSLVRFEVYNVDSDRDKLVKFGFTMDGNSLSKFSILSVFKKPKQAESNTHMVSIVDLFGDSSESSGEICPI